MHETALPGLERSCATAGDAIRLGTGTPGVERIAARFAGRAYEPHRHDSYAIGLTLGGVQSFDYRGTRADGLAGCALVIHPDERHDGRAGDAGGFVYRMAYVEPRLVLAAAGGRLGALPFLRDPVSRDPRLVAAVRGLLDDLDAPLEPLAADAALAALADALVALDPSAARRPTPPGIAAAVERARDHLAARAREAAAPVRSQALEALTGLDRYTLARQFRRRYGTSPYRYLVLRRLGHARTAIRAGTPLAEAALDAGFADQSHLTRQFKKAYGITPERWRRMISA
ncbi:AraC family transcriptional regulator [Salinarimonas rosea]|uniref:AraC family transcriptional regulator n=1 Tax=Salinarimonas rosea TaxID=552063 RepID=UPI0004242DD2|nr:AraC family transcriptional regulator [Salinarimonas rosea]